MHTQVGQNVPAPAVVPCLEESILMVDSLSLQTQVGLVSFIVARLHLGALGIVKAGI